MVAAISRSALNATNTTIQQNTVEALAGVASAAQLATAPRTAIRRMTIQHSTVFPAASQATFLGLENALLESNRLQKPNRLTPAGPPSSKLELLL